MRKLLCALFIGNLLHLYLVLPMGDLLSGNAMVVYPFVVPHLIALTAALGLLAAQIITRSNASLLTGVIVCALLLTAATSAYAFSRWPGSDDGGGMFWLLVTGTFGLLNVGAALALTTLTFRRRNASAN